LFLFGNSLSFDKKSENSKLKIGQSIVVESKSKKISVYKTKNGINALDYHCYHMGVINF
jgi:hypothetical protein